VTKYAALNDRVAVCHPQRHSYLGSFAEVFLVADQRHIGALVAHDDPYPQPAVDDGS
jgi:hypothetical protein